MPKEITHLEEEADTLYIAEQKLKRLIDEERNELNQSVKYFEELENTFLKTLLIIGLPGVSENDIVSINKKTWDVHILPDGNETLSWNFYNAGSGGKKTLFNVCYLLSIHLVAAQYGLPLPSVIIIDTPMKNIGEDVNKDIFENFYKYLYKESTETLSATQFIIIDKEFIPPEIEDIDLFERYLTPDEDESPPLISYYRGP